MSIFIDGYEIDAAINETHTLRAQVTDHPVEEGSDVTDNVRLLSRTFSVQGVVSDSPLEPLATMRNSTTLPSEDALARLTQIWQDRQPVTVESHLGVLTDMVLDSLTIPVNAQTGRALRFTGTFKQVRIVRNIRTSLAVAVPIAANKQNLGSKPSNKPEDAATEKSNKVPPANQRDKSWLKQLVD